MQQFRFAAGLLALAAGLAAANQPVLALTRETPLQVAQQLEARTSGGLHDPTRATPASDETPRDQRDARLR